MRDISAVAWLPLGQAVKRLSYPLEKLFLESVGRALKRRHDARRKAAKARAESPDPDGARRHADSINLRLQIRRVHSAHGATGAAFTPQISQKFNLAASAETLPKRLVHAPFSAKIGTLPPPQSCRCD